MLIANLPTRRPVPRVFDPASGSWPNPRTTRAWAPRGLALRGAALAVAALCLACGGREPGGGDSPAEEGDTPPPTLQSAVLVTLDSVSPDALGAYGSARKLTPNLDRLASGGIVFTACSTSSPSTLPAHATILTGRQPWAHGVRTDEDGPLAEHHTTLAEVFPQVGYATAAEVASPLIGRASGLARGFEQFGDPESLRATGELVTVEFTGDDRPLATRTRDGADVTDRAIAFLRERSGEPFFLWLHYFDAHAPYAAPDEFRREAPRSNYHAAVHYIDHQIGRLVEALDELGLADSTLVVVASDHGEALGRHRETTHSYLVYESTMHVPLIIWGGEERFPVSRVSAVVRTADLAPTILDLLRLPPLSGVEGTSLGPLVRGATSDLELTAYGESSEPKRLFGDRVLRFVREGSWRYIHKPEIELYDVSVDPGESVNEAARQPEVVAHMQELLRAQLRSIPGAEAESLDLIGVDPLQTLPDYEDFRAYAGALERGLFLEAASGLRDLRERHPDSVPILRLMVIALTGSQRYSEAFALASRWVELAPDDLAAHRTLGVLALQARDLEAAEAPLRAVLALDPCEVSSRGALANVLGATGRRTEHIEVLRRGIECEGALPLRNDYAYLLATATEDRLRDGAEALRIARAVVEEAGDRYPAYLDTLAAAHAELGQFEEAVRLGERALAGLEAKDARPALILAVQRNLAEYAAGRPARE